MNLARVAIVLLLGSLAAGPAAALDLLHPGNIGRVDRLNQRLAGKIVDYTANHGSDRRLYCPTLDAKRDVYLYLPPGYDGVQQFPACLTLHGFGSDEKSFLSLIEIFDDAIRSGRLPPMILVAPDGSTRGRGALFNSGSFWVNSAAGRFGDYVFEDVWGFVRKHYAIRPERGAHLIAGASMGGFGAFNIGFKHREEFGVLIGILPPLNFRYGDCHGNYLADYDPNCTGYRTIGRRNELVGVFYGVLMIRARRLLDPLTGYHPLNFITGRQTIDPNALVSAENPIELLDRNQIRPGEFDMFISYGTKDEFNIDAQVKSFLAIARARGIDPTVLEIPDGRHNIATGKLAINELIAWLGPRLAPYGPPPAITPHCAIRRFVLLPGLLHPSP